MAPVLSRFSAYAVDEKPRLWAANAEVYSYTEPRSAKKGKPANIIVGRPARHRIEEGETLLDLARQYHLGYTELVQANPEVDPWVPRVGLEVHIPTVWILPKTLAYGLVLNIPEMRLYYYLSGSRVMTFPLGVGMEGWDTPAGTYWIGEKRKDPVWYVPLSIQKEMREPRRIVPPGPENPLGRYWMRLSTTSYGIHGTNNPWAVGRHVTHGCIRLYPEDIKYLYPRVPHKTPVEVMYKHAKIGFKRGKPYFQIHRFRGTEDSLLLAELIAQVRDLDLPVDLRAMRKELRTARNGTLLPVPLKTNDNN